MPQLAEKVIDHEMLFRQPEYQELFAKKKEYEFNHSDATVAQTVQWTKTEDYKQKNFARDSLTVNPAKACQPLGAVSVPNGFAKTLRCGDGSPGCVALFRSLFSRFLKGPTWLGHSPLTE